MIGILGQNPHVDFEAEDQNRVSILNHALMKNNESLVQILFERGADFEKPVIKD